MDIKGLRSIASLFQRRGNNSASALIEEAASRRETRRAERQAAREDRFSQIRSVLEQRRELRSERRASREGSIEQPTQPPTQEPVPSPTDNDEVTILPIEDPSTSPVQQPEAAPPSTPAAPVQAESIDDLAELYVRQFETGAGVSLSEEAFEAKKSEVAEFYSGIRGGRDRLDAIVFANDEIDTTA